MAQQNRGNWRFGNRRRNASPDEEEQDGDELERELDAEYQRELFAEFERHYRPNKFEHLTLGVPDVVVDDVIRLMPLLEETWHGRKMRGPNMRPIVFEYLEQTCDPFYMTLQVCVSCSDYETTNRTNTRDSLALYVVHTFGEWLAIRKPDRTSDFWEEHFIVDGQLQSSAFYVAAGQNCFELVEAICAVYRLSESTFVGEEHITKLIPAKKFTLACYFVVALRWQKRFEVIDIVVPLYMLDRYDLVSNYLKSDRDTQIRFVAYLDQFCSNDKKAAAQELLNKLDVTGARRDKLDPRNLAKALGKMVKKYNVPKEKCPCLTERQGLSTLRFIAHRFYQENAVPEADFEDMINDHVADNRKFQMEAVVLVYSFNDTPRAVRLARRWGLPRSDLPSRVSDAYDQYVDSPIAEPEVREAPRDRDGNAVLFYSPSLSIDVIQFVDTVEKFEACIRDISNNALIVGIDLEWKPIVNNEQRERLALMQLAYRDKVYLLDFLGLGRVLEPRHYFMLLDDLLINPNILKLGFSLHGDWKVLAQAHETFQDVHKNIANLCDLRVLCEKVLSDHPQIFPFFNGKIPQGRSLVTFTELGLGVTLDKSQQWSNWERRPLHSMQTIYAAKDAYVLLDLYQVILDGCQRCNVQFEVINKSTSEAPNQVPTPPRGARGGGSGDYNRGHGRGRGGGRGRGQARRYPNANYRGEVRLQVCRATKDNRYLVASTKHSDRSAKLDSKPTFVVDNMLQGLGRRLRIFGFDTFILENEDYHSDIVKIALRDGRIVLSSGIPCQTISSMVPDGMCYSVENGCAKEQAIALIKHFKVQLRPEDLFGRCQVCNGGIFLAIPKDDFILRDQPNFLEKDHRYNDACSMNLLSFVLDNGVTVQICDVSKFIMESVDTFNVCYTCGKVYWEGTHRGRLYASVADRVNP